MIFSMDDSVRSAALPRHIQVDVFSSIVLHGGGSEQSIPEKKDIIIITLIIVSL